MIITQHEEVIEIEPYYGNYIFKVRAHKDSVDSIDIVMNSNELIFLAIMINDLCKKHL